VEDWLLLDRVDPFAPVMTANAASLVADLPRTRPEARLAAVLRPCEIRALGVLRRQARLPANRFIIVGVDCLGTYPSATYSRRAEQEGRANLTTELVERGRDGDLPVEHIRPACQMCLSPVAEDADVALAVIDPKGRELILITASDGETARRLHLDEITDGEAPGRLVIQYRAWQVNRARREALARAQRLAALSPGPPGSPRALQARLAQCAPCQACLDACPRYIGQFSPAGNGHALELMQTWLSGCAQCGMCEAACPPGLPLTAVFARLKQAQVIA
jgi:formate dehydrogenase subunit beta